MPVPEHAALVSSADFARLREIRLAGASDAVSSAFAERIRRPFVKGDGRLFIIAADHPARGALSVGSNRMAMADRYDLLQRVVLALSRPGVDGVLATPDIIDDLALLGALDGKLAVGSMNRGGLYGSVFEMDDRFTAHDIPAIVRSGLDAAKLLVRMNLRDPGTARTLEATANAVNAAVVEGVPILLEPFMSSWIDGRIVNDLTPDAVMTSVSIASSLGSSSVCTWMKLPVVEDMERVMASTTLPTLLLGGDPNTNPEETYASWARSLALPGVHGLMVGRTLLYPKDDDVVTAVDTAAALVHTDG